MSPPIGGPRRPHDERRAEPLIPTGVSLTRSQVKFLKSLARRRKTTFSNAIRICVETRMQQEQQAALAIACRGGNTP